MEEFKTSLAAAKRLRNYLTHEHKSPIVFKDGSSFEWREFVVVPFDLKSRKEFVVSCETNVHNTMPEILCQYLHDQPYRVASGLNSER